MTGSGASSALVAAARAALAEAADPVRAEPMRAYMKSTMLFWGVPSPGVKRIVADVVADYPLPNRDEWLDAVLDLWRGAGFREERYVALGILGHRRYRDWRDAALMPVYEELLTTGAWWDFVDEIASHHVGAALLADPAVVEPIVRTWITSDDLWLRRTSIICQLRAKAEIDLALLIDAIEANLDDREFFIRKAIGWALRQHARVDPDWVLAFVDSHPGLSPLSRREATKHL